jgi:translocation and assembly module TamA
MSTWRHLVVAVAASACAHSTATRAVEDRLERVDFEGNQQLKNKTLLTGLGVHRVLQRSGAVDPYMIQVDADRIRGEYLRKGYLDVDVRSRVERKADTAAVIYTIEEGARSNTKTLILGLPDDFPAKKVRDKLPLVEGKPFDYEVYDLAKPNLLQVVQDEGYAHAQLDASVIADRANHTAVVLLVYTPGPKCTFGNVEITGATGELAEAALHRLAFAPGQPYSAQAIVQTQRNLYGFGRFSTVRVDPDKEGGEVVGVKVAVAEGARHELKLGGGLGMDQTNYEVRGRAGYSIAGWPFPLDTVTLDFRPAYAFPRDGQSPEPRMRTLAKLDRQDLFWTYAKGTVEGGYNFLTVEAFTSYGPFTRLGFETRLGSPRLVLRLGWGFESVNFRKVLCVSGAKTCSGDRSPEAGDAITALKQHLNVDAPERVGMYQQALVVDLRDHPIEPTLGGYAELRVSEGTRFAGGAYEYFAVQPDVRGYLPLPVIPGAVLAARVRYGAIFADKDNVPPTERLFAGGASSQRGFGERRLSPHTDLPMEPSVPYGGTRLIDTGIEARVPITKIRTMPLGVAVFLDGGDVTDAAKDPALTGVTATRDLDLSNLHWALGAGLRLQTVVGPVRLDVAYRLNRTEAGEPEAGSHYAYHLTVGEAF